MDELITKTAAELAAAVAAGEVSAAEVTTAHLDRIAAVDDRVKAFLHVAADDALAQAREVDRRRAAGEPLGALAGRPGRGQGPVRHRRDADDLRVEDPRRLGTRRTSRRSPGGCATRAPSSSARPTWTSSRWARPRRTPGSGRRTTRGTWPRCPAAPPAARPPPSPPTRRRSRSARTPAARSASPPRCAGSSAPSRPTAATPGTGSSRSRRRWTRRARSAGPSSTPPCCTRPCPGTTRWTPRRSTPRCRRSSRRRGTATWPGCGSASSASSPATATSRA